MIFDGNVIGLGDMNKKKPNETFFSHDEIHSSPQRETRRTEVSDDLYMASILRSRLTPWLQGQLHFMRNRITYYNEHFTNGDIEDWAITEVEKLIKEII